MTIRSLNSVFGNQFKCIYNPGEMESFVLKVPILGPHLPIHKRNAISRAGFTIIRHSTSKGFRAQMVRLFFGLHLHLAGRPCENLPSAKSPAQYKSGQGNNMVSRRNHLLYHFKITIHLHLTSFYATKYFWKTNYLGKCSLNKPLNLNSGGLYLLVV